MRPFIQDEKLTGFGVPLRLILTEPGVEEPPPGASERIWFFDTGYDGDAFAWRGHILDAGLDPDVRRDHRRTWISSSLSAQRSGLPIRKADLWLVGDALTAQYYPLRLRQGVAFKDEPIPPEAARAARPLVGMRLLLRAKIRIELNLMTRAFSIWVPDGTVGHE